MAIENVYENLLTSVLDCGYLDLQVIQFCEYDFDDMIEEMKDNGFEVNLNNLAYMMFEFGKRDIQNWINGRIETINDLIEDEEDTVVLQNLNEELTSLQQLEPYEDIESFHNYYDTTVYFLHNSNKETIYKKYCQEALDTFEEKTGFSL